MVSFVVVAASASIAAAACTETQTGLDYPFNDINMTITDTAAQCCELCGKTPGCVMYVWSPDDTTGQDKKHCWLKKEVGHPAKRADRISGRNPNLPPTPPPSPLPPSPWSTKYRNWHYYTGGSHGGFVVPPKPLLRSGGKPVVEKEQLVDCSVVWEEKPTTPTSKPEYRMFYTIFDGSGYRTALATSADLLDWNFSNGVIFDQNPIAGSYDYGGVTFGCPLYENASVTAPRYLQQIGGKNYVLYGAYPNRGHYESGKGAEGIAWCAVKDGETCTDWQRESATVPIMSTVGAAAWEKDVVYQPNIVVHNGTAYDFYNAHGTNAYGKGAEEVVCGSSKARSHKNLRRVERVTAQLHIQCLPDSQSGVATLPMDQFPGIDHAHNTSLWERYAGNPVIKSGEPTSFDSIMASDPKVWWDDEMGYWVMFYFGLGGGSGGHADIMLARSSDLLHWEKDLVPLYEAGHHPSGIDGDHAHKISLIYDRAGVGYLYYTAVGSKGRGIALLTSKPVQ